MNVLALDLSSAVLVTGVLTGLLYALLAVGLVLVFRASRIINFAYGEVGAVGAAILARLVHNAGWPYPLAFVAMVAFGAALGALVEAVVVRRLRNRPPLVLVVATIGVAELLLLVQLLLPLLPQGEVFPLPFDRVVDVGSVRITSAQLLVIAFVPAVVAGLGLFLNRTPLGLGVRGAADNPDAARLAGLSTRTVSLSVWALAGALATVTAILVFPLRPQGAIATAALGPALLLRALAAGLVGRLRSLPAALVGGVGLGVGEAVLYANTNTPGVVDAGLLVVVLGLVLWTARHSTPVPTVALTPRVRPLPERYRSVWWVRRAPHLAAAAGLAVALVLPLVLGPSQLLLWSRVAIFTVVALSVTILTGWAGQLSLGQFAFVGIGAMGTASLVERGMPFGIAVVCMGIAGAAVAVLVGLPALRVEGLYLAVTTLAFAVAVRAFVLPSDLLLGNRSELSLPRPKLGPIDFRAQGSYYLLCLAVAVAAIAVTVALRRSGVGRGMIAVRENQEAAASFVVAPTRRKLEAFAVSGAMAAVAGGLLAGLSSRVNPVAFGPEESLRAVAVAVIGGLGSVPGAVLGAIYVLGIPAIFDHAVTVGLFTSGAGLLVLLLYVPGGLVSIVQAAWGAALRRLEHRLDLPAPERAGTAVAALPARQLERAVPHGVPALRATDVTVRFGGRVALDRVGIEAAPGECVGLIGANGAGKSTLMDVISGFTPAEGTVEVLGVDVTGLGPTGRARAGLGRVFQDARLFRDLTVAETVAVALEGRETSELVPSMLALPPSRRAERSKRAAADDLVAFFGLGRYAGSAVAELSTGTRRIVELACLLALEPAVLLLDEPTAGVAQRETEAFGPLIRRIQQELGATVLIIEHDMPLVLSLSDRVYCLGAGQVLAEGPPDRVRSDPAVIASYLGTDDAAIARSGALATGARR